MIRRLFWLVTGALLGVAGYRRVTRLARAVTLGGRRGDARAGGQTRADELRAGRPTAGWAHGMALFARDVREGMELYADRHPRLARRTLEVQQARAQRPGSAGPDDHHRARPRADYAKEGR